jgi:hypothetical protein
MDLLSNDASSGPVALVRPAYRLRLRPGDRASRADFNAALAQHAASCKPFWAALARHLAKISTVEDRALLIERATRPEGLEPPLSWAIKYIARGDVPLNDGTEVTLDDLGREVGLDTLPYLDGESSSAPSRGA